MINKLDKNINKVIEEMMGFSLSSDKLANDILKYIDDQVKAGEIRRIDSDDIQDADMYIMNNHIAPFTVDGKPNIYALEISLINFPKDFPDDDFWDIVRNASDADCCLAKDNDNNVAFVIRGNLFYKDWELTKFNKGVFHHEIKHAFTHIKTLSDQDLEEYMSSSALVSSRTLYNAALELMHDDMLNLLLPSVVNIAKGIYISDTQEMGAFTQQAYKEMESVTSFQEADRALRNTAIYKFTLALEDIIDHVEEDENLYNLFVGIVKGQIGPDAKIPTKYKYLKMMKKRLASYKTRVGKVLVYTKDRLREDALKEGYMVPLILNDASWSEVYKLGLY